MTIEPIGIATFIIGLFCLWRGPNWAVIGMIIATVFGAAAASIIGGTTLPPSHLFMGFLALAVVFRPGGLDDFVEAFRPPRPGFWLLALMAYAVIGAQFLPRLFSGMTYVVPMGDRDNIYDALIPLQPTIGNVTQSIYMVGDLVVFGLVCAVLRIRGGVEAVVYGVMALAGANVFFALLDLGTYMTGTASLLDFMRNSTYVLHTGAEAAGLKRIVGSFSEAATFGRVSMALLGFTATMWLCGRYTLLSGVLAAATIVLLVLSTSSAALAGLPFLLIVLYITAIQLSVMHSRPTSTITVALVPIFAAIAIFGLFLLPNVVATIFDFFEQLIFQKMTTDSGVERSSWNSAALDNFVQTWGFGVGAGTTRASSLLFALIASVGVAGLVFYLVFLSQIVLKAGSRERSFHSDATIAARNACLGCVIGDLLVAASIDQGLLFYLLAALAVSLPASASSAAPVMRSRLETA